MKEVVFCSLCGFHCMRYRVHYGTKAVGVACGWGLWEGPMNETNCTVCSRGWGGSSDEGSL